MKFLKNFNTENKYLQRIYLRLDHLNWTLYAKYIRFFMPKIFEVPVDFVMIDSITNRNPTYMNWTNCFSIWFLCRKGKFQYSIRFFCKTCWNRIKFFWIHILKEIFEYFLNKELNRRFDLSKKWNVWRK